MEKKIISKTMFMASLLYFIWLIIAAVNESSLKYNMYLSLKTWSIIGIVLYLVFIAIEIIFYLSQPHEEKEVKIVTEAIKKVVCSNCKTTFTIKDTGVRPLKYTCPNCGMEGVLRGKNIKGKKINILCEKCHNEFEVFDTGERPLAYECPVCHYKGVLS